MIIDHNHPAYRQKWSGVGKNRFNGAFFYSKEIVKYFIPNIRTTRNWITVNVEGVGCDHSIIFIHNNLHPENYNWLSKYDDLILVCGVPETVEKVKHLGRAVYLPLSVDIKDVEKYKRRKTREVAYVGRKSKVNGYRFPHGTDYITGLPRTKLLAQMAEYQKVFAVGRTAIEARILDCEVLPFDPRYPDPDIWKVIDSREAVEMLKELLND